MPDLETVTVSILDKDYQVSCKPEEVSALKESARYVDQKMREIKTRSSVFGLDRIAVMAALNIANDLLGQKESNDTVISGQASEIKHLTAKLEIAIKRLKAQKA